jgi:hypothetical protein
MITWLEPAPALREFVRWYVYIHRTATAPHPVLPVLETRLAFYPRARAASSTIGCRGSTHWSAWR